MIFWVGQVHNLPRGQLASRKRWLEQRSWHKDMSSLFSAWHSKFSLREQGIYAVLSHRDFWCSLCEKIPHFRCGRCQTMLFLSCLGRLWLLPMCCGVRNFGWWKSRTCCYLCCVCADGAARICDKAFYKNSDLPYEVMAHFDKFIEEPQLLHHDHICVFLAVRLLSTCHMRVPPPKWPNPANNKVGILGILSSCVNSTRAWNSITCASGYRTPL